MTAGRRVDPALVAAVAVLALVGLALWKPWVDTRRATDAQLPSASGFAAAAASMTPAASASPVATPTVPVVEAVDPPLYPLFGLDLGFMGTTDHHAAWGIAVAYAPSATIARAVASRRPTITPVVDWQALRGRAGPSPATSASPGGTRPDAAGPGPTMAHPESVTIAVAVTWPHMPAPRAVRLYRTGTISSTGGAVTHLPSPQRIRLAQPLPLLVLLAPYGVESLDPGPLIDSELTAGTFFLPSHRPPADIGGWLTGGWPPGAYAFLVTQADGTTRTLPFVLRG